MTETFRVHDAVDDLVDDLVDRARATIEDLDAQIHRITVLRENVREFLASVRGAPAPTIVLPVANGPTGATWTTSGADEQSAAVKATLAKATAPCPECGQEFGVPFGLPVHRKRKHGVAGANATQNAKRRTAAPSPEPAPSPKAAAPTVLACSDCPATFAVNEASKLNRHCLAEHHRVALPAERTPVPA